MSNAKPTKYIRHRDLKMKGSELAAERRTQHLMCQGVCEKCQVKLKWKFNYDKYKPLRHPGICSDCKGRKITKAYRTLCDPCAMKKRVCANCCESLDDQTIGKSDTNGGLPAPEMIETRSDNDEDGDGGEEDEEDNETNELKIKPRINKKICRHCID